MTPETTRIPYLPGLDGIRALAVLAVVLYHLGAPAVPGGFLGVDVFFVLSGFLITSSLVVEHRRSGRLDLGRFLLRRARRLLPALWLMLLVVCTTAALAVRAELAELRVDVPAALVYLSNWSSLAGDQSYFEASGRPPLLQHLWSLAIEGQFYLLWPVAVAFLLRRAGPGGPRRIARVALGGAAASTALMAAMAVAGGFPIPNDPSPAYLGSASHAMGLLLGSALGAVWAPWTTTTSLARAGAAPAAAAARGQVRSAPWWLEGLGVVGLVGLVGAYWWTSSLSVALYRGGFGIVSVLAALLVAALAHPGARLGRLLGTQPWRYLGQRSYGIYLWHWPVLMLSRPGFELAFDGVAAAVLRLGVTLVLAEASYRWVELPVRRGAVGRWAAAVRAPRSAARGGRSGRMVVGPVALGALVVALGTVLVAPPVVAREPGAPVSVVVRP
ncbi:acyltransferase family protein, partial [Pengzhenrongella frigida]|uniref:acyltransferase family protein n=1 Tax=Pengzhenrongella frigida TaxID=1259133 RepID=UPI0013EB74E4